MYTNGVGLDEPGHRAGDCAALRHLSSTIPLARSCVPTNTPPTNSQSTPAHPIQQTAPIVAGSGNDGAKTLPRTDLLVPQDVMNKCALSNTSIVAGSKSTWRPTRQTCRSPKINSRAYLRRGRWVMGTPQRKKIRRPGFSAGLFCLDCKVFGWRFLASKRRQARAKRGPLGLIGAGLNHTQTRLPHPRELHSERPPVVLKGHTLFVRAVDFTPDARTAMTAASDGLVRFWDAATGKQTRVFDWKIGKLSSAAFSPDGLTCAAGGENGQIVVWDVD